MKSLLVAPRILACLLGVSLLSPLSAAAGSALNGELTVTMAQAEGPHQLVAPLVAFLQQHRPDTDPLANPSFQLTAERLRIQTYSFDPTFHVNGIPITAQSQASTQTYHNAAVEGTTNRDNYRWYLFSLRPGDATVEIQGDCSSIEPSSEQRISRSSKVAYDAPDNLITVPSGAALQWRDCSTSGATLSVTGKFLLMLWEWDAILHTEGRDQELPSGQKRSAIDPVGSPESSGIVSHDRQRYLYVDNGKLTVAHLTGTNNGIYLGAATLDGPSALRLRGSTGALMVQDRRVNLDQNTLQLTGPTQGRFEGTGAHQPFDAQMSGLPNGVLIDGKPLSLSAAAAPPDWAGLALLGAGLVLLLWLLGVWLTHGSHGKYGLLAEAQARLIKILPRGTWRQRRAMNLASRGVYADQMGRGRSALLWITLAQFFGNHPQLYILRIHILRNMGRRGAAMRMHAELDRRLEAYPLERARNAWQAFKTAPTTREAKEWFLRARSYDVDELTRLLNREFAVASDTMVGYS